MTAFTYKTIVTAEEILSTMKGYTVTKEDAIDYVKKSYPNMEITRCDRYVNTFHIEGLAPQSDYVPIPGQFYATTSFDEIRAEIREQFPLK